MYAFCARVSRRFPIVYLFQLDRQTEWLHVRLRKRIGYGNMDVHMVRREDNGPSISALCESLQDLMRIVNPVASRIDDAVWAASLVAKDCGRSIRVRRHGDL